VVAYPKKDAMTCMMARAAMAADQTINRECFIAMIAAMKKVLSPSSDTMMTDKEAMNAWKKLLSAIADPWLAVAIISCGDKDLTPPSFAPVSALEAGSAGSMSQKMGANRKIEDKRRQQEFDKFIF